MVVIWKERGRSKEGLSEEYGRGDNSEEPAGQDPANSLKDSGAIDKGFTYRLGPGGAVIGCLSTSAISKILHRITQESSD